MSRGKWKRDTETVDSLTETLKVAQKTIKQKEAAKPEKFKVEQPKKDETKKIVTFYNSGVPVYYEKRNGRLFPVEEDK